jgi:acyl dehydratase
MFDPEAIGRSGPVHRYDVTDAVMRGYAEATDDVVGGPVFAVVPVWEAIHPASRSVASEEARKYVVHYAQDMLLHRPLEAGMTVVSQATPLALVPRPNGTSLVIKTETRAEDGELVNEQYVTEFFRGVRAEKGRGEHTHEHRLEVEGEPIAQVTYRIAEDQPDRYAAASGDDFAIHLDDEFARKVGLPGRIVHGLGTMAFAGRAVLEAAGVADPRAVTRLAVRFSAPLFPGETLTTRVWPVDGGFGFESLNGEGRAVLKDGRAALRSSSAS